MTLQPYNCPVFAPLQLIGNSSEMSRSRAQNYMKTDAYRSTLGSTLYSERNNQVVTTAPLPSLMSHPPLPAPILGHRPSVDRLPSRSPPQLPSTLATTPYLYPHSPQASTSQIQRKSDDDEAYICSHCGSIFKKIGHLNRHTLKHEGIRFQCEHIGCRKTFSRLDNMRMHMKNIHGTSNSVLSSMTGIATSGARKSEHEGPYSQFGQREHSYNTRHAEKSHPQRPSRLSSSKSYASKTQDQRSTGPATGSSRWLRSTVQPYTLPTRVKKQHAVHDTSKVPNIKPKSTGSASDREDLESESEGG